MTENHQDLAIRGESIERIYSFYREKRLIVNRRYQRKLVWTVEEKRSFIDSVTQGFPVPLILLAETAHGGAKRYEIIDGMQRLNAIVSFVEGEFALDGKYFDLEAIAETKLLLDEGHLTQNEPKLDRRLCAEMAGYVLPLSIYQFNNPQKIDLIFRRINSGGRHLSRQELRQAGAIGLFANLVREISCSIRGDVSASDTLLLNAMKDISITNKDLKYGISVDDVFWVKESILTREYVRQSRDEEIIADILGYVLLNPKPGSHTSILDEYFGLTEKGPEERKYLDLEAAIQKVTPEQIKIQFLSVIDVVKRALKAAERPFSGLVLDDTAQRVPRYFQAVFLAIHELVVAQEMVVEDYGRLAKALEGIGRKINVDPGGGWWSAQDRQKTIEGYVGVLASSFKKRGSNDPALNPWITQLENLLMQSQTEQSLYDFKQGFHALDNKKSFNDKVFSTIIKTLAAISNHGPGVVGYVVVGIADRRSTAEQVKKAYGVDFIPCGDFFVTGVQGEAELYDRGVDGYFQFLQQRLQKEPIPAHAKSQISRDIRLIKYYDKAVLVFKVEAGGQPCAYNDKFYERQGPNLREIPVEEYADLFGRFQKKA